MQILVLFFLGLELFSDIPFTLKVTRQGDSDRKDKDTSDENTVLPQNSPRFLKKLKDVKSVYKWIFLYKWPLYDHSWPFFCHMSEYLSQNWGSDGHFEVLNGSKFWLGQKLWHELQIFPFLFFLPFCTKTDICIFFVFCVLVSFVISFDPIKI